MEAGVRGSGATSARDLPAFCPPADIRRTEPFPHGPMGALDHELEGNVVAARHVDLARLDGGQHARRPVVTDDGPADDHELLVVISQHSVDGAAWVAEEVAILHAVLTDIGEQP